MCPIYIYTDHPTQHFQTVLVGSVLHRRFLGQQSHISQTGWLLISTLRLL